MATLKYVDVGLNILFSTPIQHPMQNCCSIMENHCGCDRKIDDSKPCICIPQSNEIKNLVAYDYKTESFC